MTSAPGGSRPIFIVRWDACEPLDQTDLDIWLRLILKVGLDCLPKKKRIGHVVDMGVLPIGHGRVHLDSDLGQPSRVDFWCLLDPS